MANFPTSVLIAIVIASIAALILLTCTLVVWSRTPAERFNTLPKWVWLIIIVISQPFGPIIFLTIGRTNESASESMASAANKADIVDLLYSKAEEQ